MAVKHPRALLSRQDWASGNGQRDISRMRGIDRYADHSFEWRGITLTHHLCAVRVALQVGGMPDWQAKTPLDVSGRGAIERELAIGVGHCVVGVIGDEEVRAGPVK